MTIATSIQMPMMKLRMAPSIGMIAKTRRTPGELENPIVRSNSPMSAFVCGSGNSLVPIKYVRNAQINHPSRATMVPKKSPFIPVVPIVPIPAVLA